MTPMSGTVQLHLAAGVASLSFGLAALVRDPDRRRNRLFAALCGAIAIWTIGVAADVAGWIPRAAAWRPYLLGSCLSAPLALHFALAIAWPRRALPRVLLGTAYAAAAVLWVAAIVSGAGPLPVAWRTAAIAVLGAILALAVALIARHAWSLPAGPERRAHHLIWIAAAIAVLGGISDFLPRGATTIPTVGPLAVLGFLLGAGAVTVRHRFLDVQITLARAVLVLGGAVLLALGLDAVIRIGGTGFLTLYAASVALILAAPAVTRLLRAGSRTLDRGDPTAAALVEVSRRLPAARTPDAVWAALEEGRRLLPAQVRVALLLADTDGRYVVRFRAGGDPEPQPTGPDDGVPAWLRAERGAVGRDYLRDEAREAGDPARRTRAGDAVRWMDASDTGLLVPLFRDDALDGWIAVGGLAPGAVTPELTAALVAVGNQAIASMGRLDALEEAERRRTLAVVGEMAAGLSHEVRNPVAAIRGAAQAMGPGATEEQTREMLEVLDEETDRLGRVVGEFLEYARPGSPRRDAVELRDLLRRVEQSASLAGFDLRFDIDIAPDAATVTGDADALRRVFENLVRNAWEAGGPGGRVRIAATAGADGAVTIRIADDGPGLSAEARAGLFRPFHTTKSAGTGLGLALVHRIVEDHGGTVAAEDRNDPGAVFVLHLPGPEETT